MAPSSLVNNLVGGLYAVPRKTLSLYQYVPEDGSVFEVVYGAMSKTKVKRHRLPAIYANDFPNFRVDGFVVEGSTVVEPGEDLQNKWDCLTFVITDGLSDLFSLPTTREDANLAEQVPKDCYTYERRLRFVQGFLDGKREGRQASVQRVQVAYVEKCQGWGHLRAIFDDPAILAVDLYQPYNVYFKGLSRSFMRVSREDLN